MQQSDGTADPALLLRPRRPRARWRIGTGAAVVLVLAAAVIAVLLAGAQASGRTRVLPAVSAAQSGAPSAAPSSAASSPALYVHVAGEVVSPGLYLLKDGARVADALAAAGGATESADPDAVNLARRVVDGEQLLVPAVGAAPAAGAAPGAGDASGPVSLSTATAAQLEELPEVGPATAAKIIAYREANGPFSSVDQLLEVPGIGEKTLEAFRDEVGP
ncbi:helix-hairpin-helix domain-containing protein [Rathayibacter sp. ZW T2_19]|uniref:Helix-hairpin-helix domain-containing protein n=1 Tax=Rathayibacter rubneri TaxID=2950106 RepID=A0A9X2DZ49_9MICO|nr:helix-hairpin-helix domain-containing protein [Rathayibacter rubneri]MCM6763905.1 helix-hairpin-helix domain-containing protein [Rathayibacter rubneri]